MTISVPQSFKWKRYSVCNHCWLGFHQSFDILAQHYNKYVCMPNNFLKKTNILLRTDHTTQVQRKRAYDDPMLKPPKGRRCSQRWEFLCSSYSLELTCFTCFVFNNFIFSPVRVRLSEYYEVTIFDSKCKLPDFHPDNCWSLIMKFSWIALVNVIPEESILGFWTIQV